MTWKHFHKGELVEVIVAGGDTAQSISYFSGTVLRSPSKTKSHIYVEYQTHFPDQNGSSIPLREKLDLTRVRPAPQTELGRSFNLCETVDAFRGGGWRKGTVAGILRYSKYLVVLDGSDDQLEFDGSGIRIHRDWNDGVWIPPLEEQKSCELEMKPKVVKLKIKFSGITSEVNFSNENLMDAKSNEESKLVAASKRCSSDLESNSNDMKFNLKYSQRTKYPKPSIGTTVEVKSDEHGYIGSWYTAIIVGSLGNDNNKFLVEYQTLKTDDESENLKEIADASYIRPCPPDIQRVDRFKMLEEVDAWYNDGWWVGIICKILDKLKYSVYFWATNEELEFHHFNLRPHQEWIQGKWIVSFQKKPKFVTNLSLGKSKKKTKRGSNFTNGTKVEVKNDEEGYSGSWYPATVLGSKGNGKYLVEYQTLKTNDEIELLKEEADVQCLRPCPPPLDRFIFKPLEEVDAWHNDGWWAGQVCKILDVLKYTVYFKEMNEFLEFQHSDLRPHQEWINGKWVASTRDWTL